MLSDSTHSFFTVDKAEEPREPKFQSVTKAEASLYQTLGPALIIPQNLEFWGMLYIGKVSFLCNTGVNLNSKEEIP
jgi:hypothetical protein